MSENEKAVGLFFARKSDVILSEEVVRENSLDSFGPEIV